MWVPRCSGFQSRSLVCFNRCLGMPGTPSSSNKVWYSFSTQPGSNQRDECLVPRDKKTNNETWMRTTLKVPGSTMEFAACATKYLETTMEWVEPDSQPVCDVGIHRKTTQTMNSSYLFRMPEPTLCVWFVLENSSSSHRNTPLPVCTNQFYRVENDLCSATIQARIVGNLQQHPLLLGLHENKSDCHGFSAWAHDLSVLVMFVIIKEKCLIILKQSWCSSSSSSSSSWSSSTSPSSS